MSTTKSTPRHGTRARYRLETKKQPDGTRGKACDRCKAANSRAAAAARANRVVNARRAQIHIVDDPPADTSVVTEVVTTAAADDDGPPPPKPGSMEEAIAADLSEIPENMQVPMHRSLSVLALQLARDFDAAEAGTSRTNASRQLQEIIRSLRTRREGDGNTAVDAFLEDFGTPLPGVPGRPA